MIFLTPSPISSERLLLSPVLASHAEAMYPLLRDRDLYAFTGGEPPASKADIEAWFRALESRQSPDGQDAWLTWIVEQTGSRKAIGYVQATVANDSADIAWLIGVDWQGQGYAKEAAAALVTWLLAMNVPAITAAVHPDHIASRKVAESAGLTSTGAAVEGEEVWALDARAGRRLGGPQD